MLTAIIAGQRGPKVLAQMGPDPDARQDRQLEEDLDRSFFTGAGDDLGPGFPVVPV